MDVFNAFKGIEDDIQQAVDATMPRQAVVVRSGDSGGVWVRFTPVDASVPEMWFPSNISDLPAGTAGWVHPLAGGKGRFIVDAIPMPQKSYARAGGAQTISSAGDYAKSGVSLVFTGLNPARHYAIDVDIDIRCWASSGTASAYPGVIIQHSDGTSAIPTTLNPPIIDTNRAQLTWSSIEYHRPMPDGTLIIQPGIRWFSGSVLMGSASISATVS